MENSTISAALHTLFAELVNGAPRDPSYMLNTGDVGLVKSLDKISADDASRRHAGGASIAAHVDHLRYGLSLMNAWKSGVKNPWAGADWTASWKKTTVSEEEWRRLRDAFRQETQRWLAMLGTVRELDETSLTYMIANTAHLAYHIGAIRQMDRAVGGPAAEAELALRAAQQR
jgi:hypothetical protein